MNDQKFDINKLRVASPCSVGWDSMTGDERVRHCHSCQLNIFNIEAMTSTEVEQLISTREGRLCIRLYRRPDGTVATNDCPVGLRGYRKRTARYAGAAFGSILGLFSISYGQKKDAVVVDAAKMIQTSTKIVARASNSIKGVLTDANGAVIPGRVILLFEDKAKEPLKKTTSDTEGVFAFFDLKPGTYRIEVSKTSGFKKLIVQNVEVVKDEERVINLVLDVEGDSVVVGIYAEEPMIDMSISGPTPTKITRQMIDRIPGGRPF